MPLSAHRFAFVSGHELDDHLVVESASEPLNRLVLQIVCRGIVVPREAYDFISSHIVILGCGVSIRLFGNRPTLT
jgi:hypothetical protein